MASPVETTMQTFAHLTLTANVGKINDTIDLDGGKKLASFEAAVNRTFKVKGQKKTEADWYTVKTTNPMLVTLIEGLKPGQRLSIFGIPAQNRFTRQDGSKGMTMQLFAETIYYTDLKDKEDEPADTTQGTENARGAGKSRKAKAGQHDEDFVPF